MYSAYSTRVPLLMEARTGLRERKFVMGLNLIDEVTQSQLRNDIEFKHSKDSLFKKAVKELLKHLLYVRCHQVLE